MRFYLVINLVLGLFFCNKAASQINTLQLKPGASGGKDAYLASFGSSVNYGVHPEYSAVAWTCGGSNCYGRGLLSFDLSSIPSGAVIVDARLNLYANTNPVNGNGVAMQGSNAAFLYRVTSPWSEMNVTWNNQPGYSTTNALFLPMSATSFQNYLNLNVTSLVADMLNNPVTSDGFMLKLLNETPYTTITFASSDYSDPLLWPELIVQYTYNISSDTCVVLSAGDLLASDAYLASSTPSTNYGSHPEFSSVSWTCQGSPCFGRGLLNFDFSQIPQGAIITTATLDLYANPTPVNGTGNAMIGSNASVLQRVVSPWTENGVTWLNQPNTTSQNQVNLPQSTSPFQNYTGLNLTGIVQDIFATGTPGYGIFLRLQNEVGYTAMIFASGDYSQSSLHPKLEVCFNFPTNISEGISLLDGKITISPNPISNQQINLIIKNPQSESLNLSLFDIHGRLIHTWPQMKIGSGDQTISLSHPDNANKSGVYLLHCKTASTESMLKLFVINSF